MGFPFAYFKVKNKIKSFKLKFKKIVIIGFFCCLKSHQIDAKTSVDNEFS